MNRTPMNHRLGRLGSFNRGRLIGLLLAIATLSAANNMAAENQTRRQFRCHADADSMARYVFTQVQMGIPFSLTLYAPDEAAANAAAAAAFERIKQLNAILSDYDADSELSRLSDTAGSGRPVRVSDPLWFVLARSQALADQTQGAFDITVGPVVQLWRRARRTRQMPPPERLAEARQAVGYQHVRLDEQTQTAELLRPNMRLDLGGIAVGYAVDQALAVLSKHGITRAMVDGSGDIAVGEPPPQATGWRVGIAPLESPRGAPSRFLLLKNAAVTTSGDAFQYVEIDGKRYSHIVDPNTGLGLTTPSSVTVVAGDCITADSLATAVSVLGPEAGLKLVEKTPHAAALILLKRDGRTEVFQSGRLKNHLIEPTAQSR